MKKVMISGLSLLSVLALAACSSGNKESKTAEKQVETTVEVSETTETTEAKEILASTVTYLTDAEIEAVQTLGDYKQAFKSLMDTYVEDFDGLIAQLPEEAQKVLEPQRDQMVATFDEQYKSLEAQFTSAGVADDAAIPAELRETLVSTLKSSRDMLKSTMETAYSQSKDMLNQ